METYKKAVVTAEVIVYTGENKQELIDFTKNPWGYEFVEFNEISKELELVSIYKGGKHVRRERIDIGNYIVKEHSRSACLVETEFKAIYKKV